MVSALLALKAHFSALEEDSGEPGVNEARGYGCEYVAWQFVTNLSERDAIDLLLCELPSTSPSASSHLAEDGSSTAIRNGNIHMSGDETVPLLQSSQENPVSYFGTDSVHASPTPPGPRSDEFAIQFENLSALEIASVSGAKKFLSQRVVQRIINGIWRV